MVKFNCRLQHFWAPILMWAAVILAFDQATKYWALETLSQMNSPRFPYGGFELGTLSFWGENSIQMSLVLAFNTGAAWSFLENYPLTLILIRSFLIFSLFWWLGSSNPQRRWPLVMLIAGACSNLADMIFRGAVVDMISFTFWGYMYPVFNVADIMICMGALFFIGLGAKGRELDVSHKHS